VAPRFIFEWEMDHVRSLATASLENTPFYARLWEDSLTDLGGVGLRGLIFEEAHHNHVEKRKARETRRKGVEPVKRRRRGFFEKGIIRSSAVG